MLGDLSNVKQTDRSDVHEHCISLKISYLISSRLGCDLDELLSKSWYQNCSMSFIHKDSFFWNLIVYTNHQSFLAKVSLLLQKLQYVFFFFFLSLKQTTMSC